MAIYAGPVECLNWHEWALRQAQLFAMAAGVAAAASFRDTAVRKVRPTVVSARTPKHSVLRNLANERYHVLHAALKLACPVGKPV